jgi:hypothetical protein
MARCRLTYRERDLSTAVKVLKAAGVPIARVIVDKSGVTIVPGDPALALDDAAETDLAKERLQHAIKRASQT